MRKLIVLILVAVLITACTLKPSDPQIQIEANAGQDFKVILESNPSTGYHWEIVGELDESVVQFVSREYRADQPVQPGSGGTDIFTFKAVGPGETTVTLGSYPPSSDATEPALTETFTVIVK